MEKGIDQINYKELDRKSFLNYIKEKKEISVEQIKKDEVVHHLRLYPIIQELYIEGIIEVLAQDAWGAPEEIRIIE